MKKINVALIGVNGFGNSHLRVMEDMELKGELCIKAICDINYASVRKIVEKLISNGVLYYKDYIEMLEKEKSVDFFIVSTPIHLHKKMAIDIMNSDNHVLLEKPPAVTIQDVDEIISLSSSTGKLCAVNFINTSGKAFLEMRDYIIAGKLGVIKDIIGVGLWKRTDNYYNRTPWSGKLAINGNYVLDGSITNPLAHLLNNMLQAASASGADTVNAVTAEMYHAHNIEGEDTACLKVELNNAVNLFFYSSLCSDSNHTPYIIVEGTKGQALWNYNNELYLDIGGQTVKYEFGQENLIQKMYKDLSAVISGEKDELYCPVSSTRNFVLTVNGAFESSKYIHGIPDKYIERNIEDDTFATYIKDINSIVEFASKNKMLFSEMGVEWGCKGSRFVLDGYKEFKL